ncbi:glycine cleavage system aminomethyltransferase GcvT [Phenylobacterium sp.]|uniref:glycine cleavage system aminomethyltransferase GcvT n=1 Tax=Phenylobacterium sp. TaxID=1871053 RepID=UPI002736961D|nr:glycine cleavage system aminomethyltransferase GcvT [Phenylobacterium sp.]MDP3658778.1 glycine cleavage system aminomethyltransferase GcvT [Phenylobacterium sp.]
MPPTSLLDLKSTPLTAAHEALGARMVEFGGYAMPVQYPDRVLKEHLWTREHAGLFDVSHMGPAFLRLSRTTGDPDADHAAIAALLEPLISGDIRGLAPGRLRYTLLLGEDGGVLDDLMVGRPREAGLQGVLHLVVNAGTKEADFARIAAAVQGQATLTRADTGGLLALQGPEAAAVVGSLIPQAASMSFMSLARIEAGDQEAWVSRSGYTGEDGFEILSAAFPTQQLWEILLSDPRVRPIGLGARDSLRLEAGLPLYGHDLDESVSPIEANLGFAVSRKRVKAGAMRGAVRIARELAEGPARVRVGLSVVGAPAREGAEIAGADGLIVGRVTSGGFSPSLGRPIAMGFVPPALSQPGTALHVIVRGKPQACEVTELPFVPHRYVRAV